MDWPYHITTSLTPSQKALRRQTLDRYGLYAHLSPLLPIALYWLYVLFVRVFRAKQTRAEYAAVPGSPLVKRRAGTAAGTAARWVRVLSFWVGGRREGEERVLHRVVGVVWALWLGGLSLHGTGDGELGKFLMSFVERGRDGRVSGCMGRLFLLCFSGLLDWKLESSTFVYIICFRLPLSHRL